MHAVIIDDQASFCLILEQFARQSGLISTINCFNNTSSAQGYLSKHKVDLFFLDIHLPNMSGFQFLESLNYRPLVIFTTSDKNRALDAFELQAVDYLVKPIRYPRFEQATLRARQLIKNAEPAFSNEEIFVRVSQKLVKLRFDEILYLEAKGDYVNFHTCDRKVLVHSTLKKLEEKLPSNQFLKIHRSYIVNLAHISDIGERHVAVDGNDIALSKAKREELIKRLNIL